MYSLHADRGFLCRVSPFRYLRIIGYVLLPEAFRSLSRLSSALSAKASTLRPYYFNRSRNDRISWFSVSSLMYSVTSAGFVFFSFSYLVINDEIWISLMSWLISISENEFYLNSCMKFSRYMLRTISFYHSRWAWVDSNHRPHAYQACALTTWATSPFGLWSFPRPAYSIRMISHPSGEYEIRTRDLLLARQALSQLS